MITELFLRAAHYAGAWHYDPDTQPVSAAPAQTVRRPGPVRARPLVDLGNLKPSEEGHKSPWQAAWDRLTPEEQA